MLLLDLKDLRAILQYVGDNAAQFKTQYGIVSKMVPGLSKLGTSRLAVTAMSNAGKFAPKVLMGGLGRAVPAAGAVYGVGRTLQSALEGDMESRKDNGPVREQNQVERTKAGHRA